MTRAARTYALPDGRILNQAQLAKELGLTTRAIAYREKHGKDALQTKQTPHGPTEGICLWCPIHEQGWQHSEHGGEWRPLSRTLLWQAQTIAKAFNCAAQITVRYGACNLCPKETP